MQIFRLNRNFFDFYTQNNECKVYHIALYFHLLQMSNSLGKGTEWKAEFGVPTNDTMQALGIGNKNTYYTTLRDLEKWEFLKIVKLSVNIYQATIVKMNFFECEKECQNEDLPLLISNGNNYGNDHAIIHADNYTKVHTSVHADDHAVVPIDIPLNLKPKDLKTKVENKKKSSEVKEWFLFRETKYFKNLEVFESDFLAQYPDYSKFLISEYHKAVEGWSKDSRADKFKKKDWLATAKNWIDKDVAGNCAKYSERSLNPQEKKDLPTLSAEEIKAIRHI